MNIYLFLLFILLYFGVAYLYGYIGFRLYEIFFIRFEKASWIIKSIGFLWWPLNIALDITPEEVYYGTHRRHNYPLFMLLVFPVKIAWIAFSYIFLIALIVSIESIRSIVWMFNLKNNERPLPRYLCETVKTFSWYA